MARPERPRALLLRRSAAAPCTAASAFSRPHQSLGMHITKSMRCDKMSTTLCCETPPGRACQQRSLHREHSACTRDTNVHYAGRRRAAHDAGRLARRGGSWPTWLLPATLTLASLGRLSHEDGTGPAQRTRRALVHIFNMAQRLDNTPAAPRTRRLPAATQLRARACRSLHSPGTAQGRHAAAGGAAECSTTAHNM